MDRIYKVIRKTEATKKMYNIIHTLISLLINRLDFFFRTVLCLQKYWAFSIESSHIISKHTVSHIINILH